jgi:type VI secretion system Hcp family effector
MAAGQYAYLKLEMQVSGWIKGNTKIKGLEDFIEVAHCTYECDSPKDQLSGIHRGRRLHKPVEVLFDGAIVGLPLAFQALTRNEKVKAAELRFYRPDGESGKNKNHTTIKTIGGGLSLMKLVLPNVYEAADQSLQHHSASIPFFCRLAYTFEEITIDNLDGKTSASDKWTDDGRA